MARTGRIQEGYQWVKDLGTPGRRAVVRGFSPEFRVFPNHWVTFLFLTPDGAVERDLSDLDASVADVRRLLRAGEEVVTD